MLPRSGVLRHCTDMSNMLIRLVINAIILGTFPGFRVDFFLKCRIFFLSQNMNKIEWVTYHPPRSKDIRMPLVIGYLGAITKQTLWAVYSICESLPNRPFHKRLVTGNENGSHQLWELGWEVLIHLSVRTWHQVIITCSRPCKLAVTVCCQ